MYLFVTPSQAHLQIFMYICHIIYIVPIHQHVKQENITINYIMHPLDKKLNRNIKKIKKQF